MADVSGLGVTGAAFAIAVLANALDFDDGHRLTKGHPGAVVIPAALAVAARLLDLDARQSIAALGLAEYHAPIAPIMRSCAQPVEGNCGSPRPLSRVLSEC